MINFSPSDRLKERPAVQMTSMIDIMFINLLFFMALFVYFHFESELNVSVPKATASVESPLLPEEVVVNILKDGSIVVNQKEMALPQLEALLRKTAGVNPSQSVILRADERTYHQSVVRVLDVCAKAKIWNISFATTKEK